MIDGTEKPKFASKFEISAVRYSEFHCKAAQDEILQLRSTYKLYQGLTAQRNKTFTLVYIIYKYCCYLFSASKTMATLVTVLLNWPQKSPNLPALSNVSKGQHLSITPLLITWISTNWNQNCGPLLLRSSSQEWSLQILHGFWGRNVQ